MGFRRNLFNSLFRRKKSRQICKLKSLLSLTVCRLSVLRNQRNARCSHTRSDIIQLLLLNQQDRALIRAELLIKEQNKADGFAMVESYCHSLSGHAFLLKQQQECPEELKEAAASLCFAASRCGDLPELQEVRNILSSLFDKDFTAAAVELRSNCGVNAKIVQKFSLRSPSLESRINVIKDIAMEKGIKMELITSHFSELLKVDESASQWNENQIKEMVTPHLDSASRWGDNVKVRAQDEYKDVVSAAQAAFESASYAAVAAKAAVKLFQSEAGKRGSCNENPCMRMEPEDHIKHLVGNTVQKSNIFRLQNGEQELNPNISEDYSTLASSYSSTDNGFCKSKVRFPEMDLEKTGEDILPDSRVWSFRDLTVHETQARVYFDGEDKIEASYTNLAYKKRIFSKDEVDAESSTVVDAESSTEVDAESLSNDSESRNNLAAHFPAMGRGPPR